MPHMNEITWFLTFALWLIFLGMIFSRSIHVVANGCTSSYRGIVFRLHTTTSASSHLSKDTACVLIWATVNNATMHRGVRISLWIHAFQFGGYIPRREVVGLYGDCILKFLRNLHTVFHSGYTSVRSHQQCTRVPLSPQPLQGKQTKTHRHRWQYGGYQRESEWGSSKE